MKKYFFTFLIMLSFMGCVHPTPIPLSPPSPPLSVDSLPHAACVRPEDNLVVIWERPGLLPQGNSDLSSDKGQDLGALYKDTELQILQFAWSETDQKYYAQIRTDDFDNWSDHQMDTPEGWLSVEYLTFDCPSTK